MDSREILRAFLQRGMQIDKISLEILTKNPQLLEGVMKIEKEKLPPIITPVFLKTLSSEPSKEDRISIDALSKVLTQRYEFFQQMLSTRPELTNLVSVNKINEKLKEFSIIGVVSGKNDVVKLEDLTGEAEFVIDPDDAKFIMEDEVIGAVCKRDGGTNEIKQVVYPDIPLRRDVGKTRDEQHCFFISDIHMDSPKFNTQYYENFLDWLETQKNLNLFVLGGISNNENDRKKFFNDISSMDRQHIVQRTNALDVVEIESMRILTSYAEFLNTYMNIWNETEQLLINLLKKRNMNPIISPQFYNNDFLISQIPDIIALGALNRPIATNYKGTTILANGSFITEPVYWKINLKTREIFKIVFS